MLQPVEFNQAVNYVNKIRVSLFVHVYELYVHAVQFLLSVLMQFEMSLKYDICISIFYQLLEPVSESARYLQIFFGNSSYLPKGAEDYQRGAHIVNVFVCS